jgi:hypothetical protein
MLHADKGHVEEALDLLEDACRRPDRWMIWLRPELYFDSRRGFLRFQDLLNRLTADQKIAFNAN